jgi:hypothetical protein
MSEFSKCWYTVRVWARRRSSAVSISAREGPVEGLVASVRVAVVMGDARVPAAHDGLAGLAVGRQLRVKLPGGERNFEALDAFEQCRERQVLTPSGARRVGEAAQGELRLVHESVCRVAKKVGATLFRAPTRASLVP